MSANTSSSELGNFHATHEPASGSVHATYLLSGELSPKHANGDGMDVDEENNSQEDGEHVSEVRMTLVGEQDLECKSILHSVRMSFTGFDSCEINICTYILRACLLPLTITCYCK